MKAALATIVLVACTLGATAIAVVDPCKPQCQQTREEQIVGCGGDKCDIALAKAVRTNCRQALRSCLAGCRPLASGKPGRCTLVRGCAQRCREALGDRAQCDRRYEAKLRRLCGKKCVRSAVTVKSCVAEFRHADVVCMTTSTSTTSSTTSTSTSLTTTSTLPGDTTSTTLAADSTPTQPDAATLGCNSCILTIASLCYLDCADNCGGDSDAIGVCHTGCRDAQCDRLENTCGPDCANCVATTTSTSTTSTSIATTTTTSTTLVGFATTTSTTIAP